VDVMQPWQKNLVRVTQLVGLHGQAAT